jgi:hypothetical protein
MKKSYKLLGVHWDHLETSTTYSFIPNDLYINNIDDEYNIFDIRGIRKINITDVLRIEDLKVLDEIIDKMKRYNAILINIDYLPLNDNKKLKIFYYKRINQIYTYFVKNMKNTKIYLSSNYQDYLTI